jgi:hypothetical protein
MLVTSLDNPAHSPRCLRQRRRRTYFCVPRVTVLCARRNYLPSLSISSTTIAPTGTITDAATIFAIICAASPTRVDVGADLASLPEAELEHLSCCA